MMYEGLPLLGQTILISELAAEYARRKPPYRRELLGLYLWHRLPPEGVSAALENFMRRLQDPAEEPQAEAEAQPTKQQPTASRTAPTPGGLNVGFSEASYDAVQKLAENRDKTVPEYVREAVALQKWFDDRRAAGWRILTEKGGRVREVLRLR